MPPHKRTDKCRLKKWKKEIMPCRSFSHKFLGLNSNSKLLYVSNS